ncbi:hypothetical protein ACOSJ1_EBGNOMHC_03842 [Bacillus mycoides KBAB4]|nr:hypothetical protein ACOSJ1_EBGNOMHC_03842 [Bacillus mycoides KBAB4]
MVICGTDNRISNLFKSFPYASISDNKSRDIGKYPIIEIGIYLYREGDYSSDMWYIQ